MDKRPSLKMRQCQSVKEHGSVTSRPIKNVVERLTNRPTNRPTNRRTRGFLENSKNAFSFNHLINAMFVYS